MSTIVINEKGQRVIQINTIMFSTKRRIDWPGVEEYLKKYVGESYVIDETDEIVYIGSDFPDEYTNSNYSAKALGTIGKAKANASQVIPELIKTASNMSASAFPSDRVTISQSRPVGGMLSWNLSPLASGMTRINGIVSLFTFPERIVSISDAEVLYG